MKVMKRYQVGYYKDGEEWLKTVRAVNEEEAIKQVKNEVPGAEIKDVNQILEMYQFEEPEEEKDTLDLTTDRFEPKAKWNEWGEFTDSGKELQESLYNVLRDKGLYPDDITVKEKDGVTKVYIDIGGDWKHEHGYLRYVMTDELGYMEINQETLPDDFYSKGGDSYRSRHTFIMFPDLVKFNKLNGLYSSKGEINMDTKESNDVIELVDMYKKLCDMQDKYDFSHELVHDFINAQKAIWTLREDFHRLVIMGQPDENGHTIGSSVVGGSIRDELKKEIRKVLEKNGYSSVQDGIDTAADYILMEDEYYSPSLSELPSVAEKWFKETKESFPETLIKASKTIKSGSMSGWFGGICDKCKQYTNVRYVGYNGRKLCARCSRYR